MQKKNVEMQNKDNEFGPVVSVLGHVDHGKTTLLDAIRKTNIAKSERGGITQKIGASQIEIIHEGKVRKITFIDTPGHAAFADMRSQGVSASDIALLIVASNDGVMPQTKESIQTLIKAKLPYIVVFTKSDLPDIVLDKVKQQLVKENVLLEGYNGDVPYIAVSAKTGDNIHDLLDLILLVYDMNQIKKSEKEDFSGVIIESKIDRRKGVLVTLVVKSGKISIGDKIYKNGKEQGKVRAQINTQGANVNFGYPGDALEIFGIKEIIPEGAVVFNSENKRIEENTEKEIVPVEKKSFDLKSFFSDEKKKTVRIILKTEGKGELEAIKNSLPSNIEIIYEGLGDITVSDVMLAKDFGAIILGFNNSITKDAKLFADNEHIFFKVYNIIYELLDEIQEVVDEILKEKQEISLGKGNILASFQSDKDKVLGVRVVEGKIQLGDKIKIVRSKKDIGKSHIVSLKSGKEEIKEVGKGKECGIVILPPIDFQIGDAIISYR